MLTMKQITVIIMTTLIIFELLIEIIKEDMNHMNDSSFTTGILKNKEK